MSEPLAAAAPDRAPAGGRIHVEGLRKQAIETGRNRLLAVGIVFAIGFSVVAGRLVEMALFQDDREPRLPRSAGSEGAAVGRLDVVDRGGVVLATSLPTASLYANPRQVLDAEDSAAKLVRVLSGLDRDEVAAKLKSRGSFVWIARNLTPWQQYEVNRLGLPGIAFHRSERRVYPQGRLASHALGLADVDGRGIAGVEAYFDESLRAGEEPLALSLDVRVQAIVHGELERAVAEFGAVGAAGIILDVHTGEVLSMVSLPDYDPNAPDGLGGDAGFNRVTKGVYEMGSTFKLFTAAMALDSGTAGLEDGYDATHPIRVARFTINDFHGKKRWLSVPEILVYSSNIGAAKMALDVGTRLQRGYLGSFGLLEPAAVELPEVGAPLAPHRWREINTLTIAYGHGLAVTPLQLASAVATLVNGGIQRRPTLLKRDPEDAEDGRRVISEKTSRAMRGLMRLVVRYGTGKRADTPGYLVGGKTGTADKLAGGGYRRDAPISSFVGAFPMQAPRFVVLVMIDEPKGRKETGNQVTGGAVAAPVVSRIVRRVGPILGLAPSLPEEMADAEKARLDLPQFASVGMSLNGIRRPRR
jgi:cell division protein FtsI (penicillin-binding protein 3)